MVPTRFQVGTKSQETKQDMIHPLRHIQRDLDDLLRSNPRHRRKGRQQQQEKASYARFSSKRLQSDTSIEDQNRETSALAGTEIRPDLQFADKGISGAEHNREGLYRMLEAAANGEFNELYVFSISRLAREYIFTMSLLKWLVDECGVRVRSKVEGIDTAVRGWEFQSIIQAIFADQARREIQENVRRGLLGNLASSSSLGDYCFGFTSIPNPNGATRKFRGVEIPKRLYAIDPVTAEWVKRIFAWYVRDNRDIQWIVRTLNDQKAPRDHRATNGHWDRSSVRRVLKSTKYIGLWAWGRRKNCRNSITGMKYRELRSDEEILQWKREFPELRIVDDETFHLANRRLKENEKRIAQFRDGDSKQLRGADGPNGSPRHLLQGLLHCSVCQSPMHVVGPNGQYLRCRGYRDGICDQRSQLHRGLAEKEILRVLSDQILRNDLWIERIVTESVERWRTEYDELPNGISTLRKRLRMCESRIQKLLDQVEDSEKPISGLNERLEKRHREKAELERDIAASTERLENAPREPNRDWIVDELHQLDVLLKAHTPAAALALSYLLRGPVLVSAISVVRRRRKAFRIEVPLSDTGILQTIGVMRPEMTASGEDTSSSLFIEIERPSLGRNQADRAWTLLHEGKAAKDIALELGVSRSRMTAILLELAETNPKGLSVKELHALARSMRTAPPKLAERLEPQVMMLFNEGTLIEDIATALRCSDATVHKAIANWHRKHDLEVPDGRTRRKQLTVKVRIPLPDRTTEDV